MLLKKVLLITSLCAYMLLAWVLKTNWWAVGQMPLPELSLSAKAFLSRLPEVSAVPLKVKGLVVVVVEGFFGNFNLVSKGPVQR